VLAAAYFLGYMAAAFLGIVFSGPFLEMCQKGLAADFSTRQGGRTDFYRLSCLSRFGVGKCKHTNEVI